MSGAQRGGLGIGRAEHRTVHAFFRALASRPVHLVAFLTLCAAYIQGGIDKLLDVPGALRELEQFGMHPAGIFLPAVVATELLGSLMVVSGWRRWFGALWLAGFTFVANLMANAFWAVHGADRVPNENAFFEHWGLIGGLLLVAWIDVHDKKLGTFGDTARENQRSPGLAANAAKPGSAP